MCEILACGYARIATYLRGHEGFYLPLVVASAMPGPLKLLLQVCQAGYLIDSPMHHRT